MKLPVGYLSFGGPLQQTIGTAYTYILAKSGVYIRAENNHFDASIKIADCSIRGLLCFEPSLLLKHGKIPATMMLDIIKETQEAKPNEVTLSIVWAGQYYELRRPFQLCAPTKVDYLVVPDSVMEIHSHPGMPAKFSSQDNKDEQGYKLYMVIGEHEGINTMRIRLGIYGYYTEIDPREIFRGEE